MKQPAAAVLSPPPAVVVVAAPPPPPLPPRPGPHVRQTVFTPDGWRWGQDRDAPDPDVQVIVGDKVREHGANEVAKILGVVPQTLDRFLNNRPNSDGTLYMIQGRCNQLEELDRRADARARMAAQAKAG